jgi:uncharacterized protein
MKIAGSVALVTGASSGIGAATARLLALQGARVILVARNEAELAKQVSGIRATGGSADAVVADLSHAEAVSRVAATSLELHGAVDILVNNAGAGRWLSVEETSASELVSTMAVPYFAAFNLTRELLPAMKTRRSGHIVNVTSVASRIVWPGAAAYTAARWAMMGFNESLRAETVGSGVRVTLAMFGQVASEYFRNNPGSEERLPMRVARVLRAEEAGQLIVAAIARSRRMVVRPSLYRLLILLSVLFPRNTEFVMCKTGWRPSRAQGPR